jgi:predicted lipoprotein with Yx(FWY)xxD motif
MSLQYIRMSAFALSLIVGFSSCSKNSSGGYGNNPPPVTTPAVSIQLKTDSRFGSVLADGAGKSLYFFSLDGNGQSACTAGCLTVWPVVYIANPILGTGLAAADFKTITRSDGALQTTYKGWPLYTYAGDGTTTDVKGDGIENIWFVAKPDYSIMLVEGQLKGNDGLNYDSTYKVGTGASFYITDDRGVTLYSFSIDKSGKNNYTAADFSNDAFWPIVQLSAVQNVPSTLDKTAFSSITVFGKPQLTYKGWPVYRFGPDSLTRGNNKGISVPSPGVWPVMDEFSATAPQ